MSLFNRLLSVWVALCMVLGIAIAKVAPAVPNLLGKMEIAGISIPISILVWVMIFPMLLKVDFASIRGIGKNPKGLVVTWIVNWLVKPFTMYAIGAFFVKIAFAHLIDQDAARGYLAGLILLGAAPCTAMVFVWSNLTNGNSAYTLMQVATNDLIILVAFAPIVKILLGVSEVPVPVSTLSVSVILFVVIPLVAALMARKLVVGKCGHAYFGEKFVPLFDNATIVGLMLTLVAIFASQGNAIMANPLHIALISVPTTLQTILVFAIAYLGCLKLRLPHDIAAPAGLIGASNFFELAVAVAIALFGPNSPATLATTVGVLTEVPVMLLLVAVANRTRKLFVTSEGAHAL